MKRQRMIIASIGLAALAIAGSISAGAASGNPAASATGAPTVRIAKATVAGKTETILVNGQGLPLYIYRPDTARTSLVTGSIARLWPPLIWPAVAGNGVTGKIAVLKDANGQQVTYNGHPLYTFADDQAGQVTGQGVQNFFVATPGIAPIAMSAGSPAPTTPTVPTGRYGY